MKKELERILSNDIPNQGFEDLNEIRIAGIQFSYKNGELIKALTKRGTYIKNNQWDEYRKINA